MLDKCITTLNIQFQKWISSKSYQLYQVLPLCSMVDPPLLAMMATDPRKSQDFER